MTACPFCDDPKGGQPCGSCGRAPTMSRRPCAACKQMTPLDEPTCSHCGHIARSELRWKIPAIILMFAAAIGASIAIQLL